MLLLLNHATLPYMFVMAVAASSYSVRLIVHVILYTTQRCFQLETTDGICSSRRLFLIRRVLRVHLNLSKIKLLRLHNLHAK